MTTTPATPEASAVTAWSFAVATGWAPFSDMECLARLLAERGFQIARGTYHHECGETLPTVVITRPDTPEWGGVWNPWEKAPEYEGDIYGEAQCALTLAGEAIAKWDKEAYLYLPNVQAQR